MTAPQSPEARDPWDKERDVRRYDREHEDVPLEECESEDGEMVLASDYDELDRLFVALRSELARIRPMAERYEWLRSDASGINDITKSTVISNQGARALTLLAGEALDAAIDAQIAQIALTARGAG